LLPEELIVGKILLTPSLCREPTVSKGLLELVLTVRFCGHGMHISCTLPLLVSALSVPLVNFCLEQDKKTTQVRVASKKRGFIIF